MSEEVLQERQLSIEEYLAHFSQDSVDYAVVRSRSANIAAIHIKKLKAPDGTLFEDTTFVEKTGVKYTIRVKL